ncbi:OLC1v1016301C1 [Oldenlandia corymbosa var. corymbosa]|uniref:OLC1v1016301C1 n=1 Tax=Oldenlandia corymbosa var. corymbosa TaxID=529605 RepID=A0AAV1E6W8_OLDCO|nr:OLC1v1016301C1 [Oldenlandia corymbosa var. corymbosa]
MRVSLKDHGLHEIVRWHDAHNCMTPVNDNDNRCVDASLIARLVRRKVEDNVDYTVASAQKDVKTLLKVDVQYKMVWHRRRKAIEAVYGDWTSNFEELSRYIVALKFTNPETIVEWEWKEGQEASFDATPFDGDDARWRVVTATRLSGRGGSLYTVNYDEHRWECRYTYGDVARSSLPPFRDQLTSLRVEDFWWQPYVKVLDRLPDFCKQGQAIWTTRCWMFCWAIREPHESGTVVRQFGYIQGVSSRPMIKDNIAFLLDHAHSMSGYPSNNWVDHHSAVRPHWRKREKYVLQDLEVRYPGQVYDGYYEWFIMNTVKLISNPKNYAPKGYETSSSQVKLYGEVLNNIRVSSEQFRDKRDDNNLVDDELEEHLNKIIDQAHAALTLGANDEIDVDDTQILVDKEPSMPSQPPPGKKAKPWSRDKIGGGRKRKIVIPPRTSQEQNEGQQREGEATSSRGSHIQVLTQFEDIGGPETQFGGESQPQPQPQPGVLFLTIGKSQSQLQPRQQQGSILTYLRREDRNRQGPNKYTPDALKK